MSPLGLKRYHAFLSYNSQDALAVHELAERLKVQKLLPDQKLELYLEAWELAPGREFQPALAQGLRDSKTCVVFLGPSGLGPWQKQELQIAIDTRARDEAFHVIPVLLPGTERPRRGDVAHLDFLLNASWVEFLKTLDDERAFRSLVWGITGTKPLEPDKQYEGVCPYRGLEAFRPDDAKFFFGRANLTGWLVSALRREVRAAQGVRFLGVLGPSGSGKSSVVLAGLVPSLKAGTIEGSERWPVAILRPGNDSLKNLAAGVVPQFLPPGALPDVDEARKLIDNLRTDAQTLDLFAQMALHDRSEDVRLVVVVDQFEEVFTSRPQEGPARVRFEQDRERFFANLLNAAATPGGRVVVVLTMRSDFLSACTPFPQLSAVLSAHQELVGPMATVELREAIERPAYLVGCGVEPGLTERLLADVERRPGALPLLQFALKEIWKKRDVHRLTLRAYDELRGVEGALEHRANEVYRNLTPEDQDLCRRLFLRLVQPGEGTEDTKRRVSFRELLPENPVRAEAVRKLVHTLADRDARLITTEGSDATDGAVEVAHEALIRGWTQLRQWVDAERQGLRTHRRLTEAAREWAAARPKDKDDYLYSGARLALSREWAATHRDELNSIEVAFLTASEEDERQRKQDELENERRLREAAEALAEAEKKQREEAQRLQLNALAGSLASQAVPLALGRRAQSDLPALLALQAHRFNEEAQGRERDLIDRALRSVLDLPHFTEVLPNREDVTSLALSPDARWLVCGCKNGALQVWDLKRTGTFWSALRSKEPSPRWTRPIHNASLVWLVAHPTLPIVACVAEDGAAFLSHLERTNVPPLRLEGTAWINRKEIWYRPGEYWIEYPPAHVAYRHDGTLLLVAAGVGFDLSDLEGCFDRGHPPPRCDVPSRSDEYFSFSTDGKVMTSYTPGRGYYASTEVHRVNLGSGSPMDSGDTVCLEGWSGGEPRREAISFCPCTISPDGRWVVQMSTGFTVSPRIKLWDVSGPAGDRHPIEPRSTSIKLWGVSGPASDRHPIEPRSTSQIFDPAGFMIFDRDSLTFATATQGGWISLWDLRRLTAAPLLLGGWRGATVAALSPGGRVMASVVGLPTQPIQIWPLAAADPSCAVLEGHKGAIRGLAFGPDGSDLVTCGFDDTVRVWDLKRESPDPLTIDLTQYGAHVIPLFDEIPLFDKVACGVNRRLGEPSRRCGTPIALDPRGGRIAVAIVGRDGDRERERVLIFRREPDDREPLILQPPLEDLGSSGVHSPVVLSLRFAAEGGILHVCEKLPVPDSGASDSSGFGIVRAWDLSGTGAEPITRLKSWGVQPQVSLDDLGTLISAVSMTGRDRYDPNPGPTGVKVWDPADLKKPPRVLGCAGDDFTAVAVSPGPRFCAAAESSGVVWVWDLSQPDAEPVARQVHFGPVLAVAFGPGDGLLAVGGDDGTVAVWALDQPEAKPIVLSGHQAAVNCLAFSPDGRLLASGSDDGTVRLWIIDLALLVELVEDRVQRNLTPTEWRRYVGPGIDYRRTCPDLPPGEDPPSSAVRFTEPLKGIKPSRLSQYKAEA